MKRLLVFFLLLCLPVSVLAKKQVPLQIGRVISQDIETRDRGTAIMPLYGGVVGVPISQRYDTVVIETHGHRMTWAEVGKRTIVLTVNGNVQFYQDKNYFVVLDAGGKKHKFVLLHDEVLP